MDTNPQESPYQEQPALQTQAIEQAQVTPTVTELAQPVIDPQPVNPKKSHRSILYLLIALLFLAIGVGTGWFLFSRDSTGTTQTKTTSTKKTAATVQSTAALQPEDVTNKIRDNLASKYTIMDSTAGVKLKSDQLLIYSDKNSASYKVSGYDFYNYYTSGSRLSITSYYTDGMKQPTTFETDIQTRVAAVYTSFGLTKTDTYSSESASDNIAVYTGKGLVCTIDNPASAMGENIASCGLLSKYETAAANAQSFVKVLPNTTTTTVVGEAQISDSKTAGYQKATLSVSDLKEIGGHAALFYRKGSGSWQYFTGTQSELGCEEYNTTDLKNAYRGEACWDTTTNKDSTVQ